MSSLAPFRTPVPENVLIGRRDRTAQTISRISPVTTAKNPANRIPSRTSIPMVAAR
jgi:hypothetical protein